MGIFKKLKRFVTKPISDVNSVVHKVTGISLPDPNNPLAALGGLLGKKPAQDGMESLMMDPMATPGAGAHQAGPDFNTTYATTLSALANSAQQPTNYQYSPAWSNQSGMNPMIQMQGLMSPGQIRGGYGYYSRNRMGAF